MERTLLLGLTLEGELTAAAVIVTIENRLTVAPKQRDGIGLPPSWEQNDAGAASSITLPVVAGVLDQVARPQCIAGSCDQYPKDVCHKGHAVQCPCHRGSHH